MQQNVTLSGAYQATSDLPESPPVQDRSQPALNQSSHGPVLIVVEDDPNDFMLLRRALWKAGSTARVWWVHNAPEALAILSDIEGSASGICVVMDVCLLGADGFDVFDQVKQRRALCPVRFAFLTGMCDQRTREHASALGADGFFLKPHGTAELAQIARALHQLAAEGARTSQAAPEAALVQRCLD